VHTQAAAQAEAKLAESKKVLRPIGSGHGPSERVKALMSELNMQAPSAMSAEPAIASPPSASSAAAAAALVAAAAVPLHSVTAGRQYVVCAPVSLRRAPVIGAAPHAGAGAELVPGAIVRGTGLRADASGSVHVRVGAVDRASHAAMVSRSCACVGSPCLRHCGHGASIGGGGWRAHAGR
jgi:uncharacterized membrane protein YgcG